MMPKILWSLPVPSTGLLKNPEFKVLPRKTAAIGFHYESDDDGHAIEGELIFKQILSFRCTYSLRAPALDAYDSLIDCGATQWLAEWRDCIGPEYKHLMITFDDGPCYEFLCSSWDYSVVFAVPQ